MGALNWRLFRASKFIHGFINRGRCASEAGCHFVGHQPFLFIYYLHECSLANLLIFTGVGTRDYYRKLDYELDGPYMSKSLVWRAVVLEVAQGNTDPIVNEVNWLFTGEEKKVEHVCITIYNDWERKMCPPWLTRTTPLYTIWWFRSKRKNRARTSFI